MGEVVRVGDAADRRQFEHAGAVRTQSVEVVDPVEVQETVDEAQADASAFQEIGDQAAQRRELACRAAELSGSFHCL